MSDKPIYKVIERLTEKELENRINELAGEGYRVEHITRRQWNMGLGSYPIVLMRLQDNEGKWL